MFRLNFWTRPFLGQHGGSGHGQNAPAAGTPIDYSGQGSAPYMPLPLSASPALMVLASGSESAVSGCRGVRSSGSNTADELGHSEAKERRASSSSTAPPPPPPGVISPHHHAAFGAFPFFRPAPTVSAAAGNADTAAAAAAAALQHQLPPIFSHLHQSLLRSHFDSAIAAAQLHQARLGAAALLGHRLAAASSGSIGRHHHHHDPAAAAGISGPAAATAYPSAFLPTIKRANAATARGAPPGFYQYVDDERSTTTTTSPVNCGSRGGSSGRAHSGRATPSSRMFGGSQHSATADDDRRPAAASAAAAAAAGSSGCSPLSFVESEPTSDHTRDAISPADQSPLKGVYTVYANFVAHFIYVERLQFYKYLHTEETSFRIACLISFSFRAALEYYYYFLYVLCSLSDCVLIRVMPF